MTAHAALLRAVNVGGTGKLAMSDLRLICEACGFTNVATYIQSGNVVFESRLAEAGVKKLLERALEKKLGKPVGVLIRSASELRSLLEANPFPKAPTNRVLVLFLDHSPAPRSLDGVAAPGGEQVAAIGRHIFIHYPNGMGQSKLKLAFQKTGTGRNLNTIRKLLDLITGLEG
jgi:uncharacterized protein (DUF1697 family)